MRIIVKYRGYAFRTLQFFLVDIWVTMREMNFDTHCNVAKRAQSCGTVIKVRFPQ
jgi:hypothetical protein